MNREFTWEELDELIEGTPISTRPWKWGYVATFIFEKEGAHWRLEVEVHSSEGWQMYGNTVTATRVVPREKIVTEWVPG